MKPINHESHELDNDRQTSPPLNTNESASQNSTSLPNPMSSNQGNPGLQPSTPSGGNYLEMSTQTEHSNQVYSTQSDQANQLRPGSASQLSHQEYVQPGFQYTTPEKANSSVSPYGYYTNQPCLHQPYYLAVHPGQPPNAAGSSMIRENPFRNSREEGPEPEGWTGFADKTVRTKFIRKVYIILTLQLLFTLGVIALFIYEPHVKQFVRENVYLYYVALAVFIPVYIGLICFQRVRRQFPLNIIALIIFTLAMSYMCATISTFYDTDIVLMAVGICAALCFVVTIFSFYTKLDFTTCGGILCILLLILILFGIIAIFFPTRVMRMLYAGLGATVFTFLLAYNTQMMMGGKNYELSPEEYVFAAIQIYIDIIYIFLFLLMLTGDR